MRRVHSVTPHVAFLIPSAGERGLANLARDAIAKFTTDVSHEVWLLDHPRGKPWPDNGSEANGAALQAMLLGLGPDVTHVFAMHDDALPIRPGWLGYLLTKPGPVVALKISQRSGFAHASGVLWDAEFIRERITEIPADMPARDVAEFPASWAARWGCHRVLVNLLPVICEFENQWWRRFDCDVSYIEGSVAYLHFGGGTIGAGRENDAQRSRRVAAWIEAARKGLAL